MIEEVKLLNACAAGRDYGDWACSLFAQVQYVNEVVSDVVSLPYYPNIVQLLEVLELVSDDVHKALAVNAEARQALQALLELEFLDELYEVHLGEGDVDALNVGRRDLDLLALEVAAQVNLL